MKQLLSISVGVIAIVAVVFFALRSTSTDQQVVQEALAPTSVPVQNNELTLPAPEVVPETVVIASPAVSAQTVSVSIDDTGFEPATVTIPLGATVVFTNNGQALHQPASDPHPVHTGLAGFDSKNGLATGETYSFTFTKAGTFGMHDHLHANIKGTIIVQ